jgi:hypothetical protein
MAKPAPIFIAAVFLTPKTALVPLRRVTDETRLLRVVVQMGRAA